MITEIIVIKDITFTTFIDGDKKHCEAVRENFTGHGNSKVEAYSDLREKMKKTINKHLLN